MKTKLILMLLVVVAVETWGIVGAVEARHVYNTCTLEVGPLCYAWEENALGKVLGKDHAQQAEEQLVKAHKAWEQNVVDRMTDAKKSGTGIQKALDDAADAAKKGALELQDKLKDVTSK